VTVSEPVLSAVLATLPPMGGPMEQLRAAARPVAVGAATAAWVLGTVANNLSGWSFTLTAVAGGVLTALAVGIPLRAEHNARMRAGTAEEIAEEASARIQLVLNDALEPLTYLIGRITDKPRWSFGREAVELQGQAKAVVLSAAAEVLGANRLRSCFFARVEEKPVQLVPSGFHGRAEEPRTTFVEGTELGDFALGLLARREDLFCADTDAASPPGWESDHKYRTFIVVPVATEARQFGILTVDGLRVGDLTEADVAAVRVLARLLAVALGA
jgi:GAF domain-containing protein